MYYHIVDSLEEGFNREKRIINLIGCKWNYHSSAGGQDQRIYPFWIYFFLFADWNPLGVIDR